MVEAMIAFKKEDARTEQYLNEETKARAKNYAQEKREKLNAIKEAQENEKRIKYAERAKKEVKHYGRIEHNRSTKPKMQKKVVKITKPQNEIDFNAYLGVEISDILLGPESKENRKP